MSSDDLYADRGPRLEVYNAVMIVIPTLSVIIRFWSRALTSNKSRRKFWWDDWSALIALAWCVATNSLAIVLIRLGVGKHIDVVPPTNVPKALKVLWATYLIYDTGLTLAKVSALLFLARIFGTHSPSFKRILYATHGLVWAWWVGIVLGTVFMCNPVKKNWMPMIDGKCGSTEALWLGSAIPSVFIDCIILVLPLPMLWRLQLRRSRKILVMGVFICGYCVILVSLGRLVTVIRSGDDLNKDLTWAGVPAIYWLGAETPITLLSISLPSVFFLVRRARQHGAASLFSSRASSSQIPLRDYRKTPNIEGDVRSNAEVRGTHQGPCNSVQHIYVGPGETNKMSADAFASPRSGLPDSVGAGTRPAIRVESQFEITRT